MREIFGETPIPNNAIRRLEEAIRQPEKGAEAALLTQLHNFFEVPLENAACPHRQDDEETYRGPLIVTRRSTLVEEREGETYMLTYERDYEILTDGSESLIMNGQKACFKKKTGEFEELVAELPNTVPLDEVQVETEDEEKSGDYSSKHFVAALDEFLRQHSKER